MRALRALPGWSHYCLTRGRSLRTRCGIAMSGSPKASTTRVCPFCGIATDLNHETQEGCIAALQEEIARMRGILAHLRPAGPRPASGEAKAPPTVRLSPE